jgi:transposase
MLEQHVFTAVGELLKTSGLSLVATNRTLEKEKGKRAAEIKKELKKLKRELAELLGMPQLISSSHQRRAKGTTVLAQIPLIDRTAGGAASLIAFVRTKL